MNNERDNDNEKIVFVVTVGHVQQESMRLIGRELTYEELYTATKCIDFGLSSSIDIVLKAAVTEAVD